MVLLFSKSIPVLMIVFNALLDSIQTNNHLYVRPKEVELNVDLLDEHDSFYHTTKSLLVLFQIMGVMPIMRSARGM